MFESWRYVFSSRERLLKELAADYKLYAKVMVKQGDVIKELRTELAALQEINCSQHEIVLELREELAHARATNSVSTQRGRSQES